MLIVFAVNIVVIAMVVIIHYEFMYRFTLLMPHLKVRHRFRIVFGFSAPSPPTRSRSGFRAVLFTGCTMRRPAGVFRGQLRGQPARRVYFPLPLTPHWVSAISCRMAQCATWPAWNP